MKKDRAGVFIDSGVGYKAFVPKKLPPKPPIILDAELISLLSVADRKLGRLDGITEILPDPDLFVAMYIRKEALISAQIEGTQASFIDVLEAVKDKAGEGSSVYDVVNYIAAVDFALKRVDTLPLSLRLIREIHAVLLQEGRGSNKSPGEFRNSQNWIGFGGSISTATFIPPTVTDMQEALYDLEAYLRNDDELPALVKIAIIHSQFETIHPFLDGNGRMGRLLITFWLCQQGILSQPLLYLSYYFKMFRNEYYDKLMAVRLNGDWEGWIKFFLKGIAFVSDEAVNSAKEIITLRTAGAKLLSEIYPNNNNHQRLYELLFTLPVITRKDVKDLLKVSAPTANLIVDGFLQHGILSDMQPGKKRNKRYIFTDYIVILQRGTELSVI